MKIIYLNSKVWRGHSPTFPWRPTLLWSCEQFRIRYSHQRVIDMKVRNDRSIVFNSCRIAIAESPLTVTIRCFRYHICMLPIAISVWQLCKHQNKSWCHDRIVFTSNFFFSHIYCANADNHSDSWTKLSKITWSYFRSNFSRSVNQFMCIILVNFLL